MTKEGLKYEFKFYLKCCFYSCSLCCAGSQKRKGDTAMSSKELLAVLCLLEKMSDTAKMECLTFLRLLRENEEMKLLAASSHQTSQPEAK